MARQTQNFPQIPQEKPKNTSAMSRDERVDQILKAMNTTVERSLGPVEGWGLLSGPSAVIDVAPNYDDRSIGMSTGLLNDTQYVPSKVGEGHEIATKNSLGELQRFAYTRIMAGLEARGFGYQESAYFHSANTIDQIHPDLNPAQFQRLEAIADKAVEFVDQAIAKRGGSLVTPPTLKIREDGLNYKENPSHLVLAA